MLRALVRSARTAIPFGGHLRALKRRAQKSPASPLHWKTEARLYRILTVDFGHLKSVAAGECVDAQDRPLPWYTYPAIEFLNQLSFEGRTVFEYGCGNSTLFWSSVATRVVSVEHDEEWYARMRPRVPPNCELVLARTADEYVHAIARHGETYDVIAIDGQVRKTCATTALSRLKPDGLMILDNSDWFPETSRVLREAGLIELDLSGFAPINDYTHTTSVYLRREVRLEPRHGRQPRPGIGSVGKSFDEAWWAPG